MNILHFIKKIKQKFIDTENILLILLIIAVSLGSFSLGRISVLDNHKIDDIQIITKNNTKIIENIDTSKYSFVASKSGSKYYATWCKSANRIKEENRIYFKDKIMAQNTGYSKAANCNF